MLKTTLKTTMGCLLFLVAGKAFSQTDSTKKKIRFSVNAALLANKSFSHYKDEKEQWGHAGGSTKQAVNSAYLPGFSVGVLMEAGRSKRINFMLGLSASYTKGEYLYSSTENLSFNEPYVSKVNYVNTRVTETLLSLNLEAGVKVKLFAGLSIAPTLLLQAPIKQTEKQVGEKTYSEKSFYPNNPQAPANYTVTKTDKINTSAGIHDAMHTALRLSLFYDFELKSTPCNVFMFRNFSVGYKLPVYGIGITAGI